MKKYFLIGVLCTMLGFINKSQAQVIVYANPLSTQAAFDEMTVLNNNMDGSTWKFTSSYAQYSYSTSNVADDYLFTPALSLEKGRDYKIVFKVSSYNASNEEKMQVRIGSDKTAAAQSTILYDNPQIANASFFEENTELFTVEEDGEYYISFYAYSDKNKWYLKLKDIEVIAFVNMPAAVTDASVVADENKELKATISWTNPTVDTHGNELQAEDFTAVKIFRNDLEDAVYVLENPIVGEHYSWVDDDFESAGSYTYSIVAYNGATPGEAISLNTWVGSGFQLPYINHMTANEFKDFTVINANNDASGTGVPNTWLWNNGKVEYKSYSKPDDWLITPLLEMQENKQYLVKIKDSNDGGRFFTEQHISVIFGTTAEVSSLNTEVAEFDIDATTFQKERLAIFRFPEVSGDYHMGLHLNSTGGDYVYLHYLSLESFAPTLLEADYDEDADLVVLNWTAPEYPDVTYTVYRNEEKLVSGLTEMSYTDNAPIENANNTYQVAMNYDNDLESDLSNAIAVDLIVTALQTSKKSDIIITQQANNLVVDSPYEIQEIAVYAIDGSLLASQQATTKIAIDTQGVVLIKVKTTGGNFVVKTVL